MFEEKIEKTIHLSDHVMLEAQHEGHTVGFRESERDGRAASADDHGNDLLSMSLVGSSPQGEEDTLAVCRTLVRKLNQMGEAWNEPVEAKADADCEAPSAPGAGGAPLRIQVVKAIIDAEMWRALDNDGSVSKSRVPIEELIALMKEAAQRKIDRTPLKQRADLVLALDANRLPVLAFDVVVTSFRERHGAAIRSAGFRSVWIVGPTESLTKRLDTFLYFAYGSNMLTRRLKERTPSAQVETKAYIEGYRLTFDKVSTDGSGKCDMEATGNPADRLYGVLFTIAGTEAGDLDQFEGLDHGYRKCEVHAVTPAGKMRAVAYMATKKDPTLHTYDWYKDLVLAGAIEHDLPAAFIDAIRAVPSQPDPKPGRTAKNKAVLSDSRQSEIPPPRTGENN